MRYAGTQPGWFAMTCAGCVHTKFTRTQSPVNPFFVSFCNKKNSYGQLRIS